MKAVKKPVILAFVLAFLLFLITLQTTAILTHPTPTAKPSDESGCETPVYLSNVVIETKISQPEEYPPPAPRLYRRVSGYLLSSNGEPIKGAQILIECW